jgi:hypothetical protein
MLLQTFPFGHEFTEGLFFFAFQYRECIEDIGEFIAGQPIKMGHVCIDLRPQLSAVACIPSVRGTIMDAAGGRPFRRQLCGFFGQAEADLLFVFGTVRTSIDFAIRIPRSRLEEMILED